MHEKFAAMGKQEIQEALAQVPSNPIRKFLIFAETARVLDYWSVFQPLLPEEHRLPRPDFQLVKWGWNLALKHLFGAVTTPGAFPISDSTDKSRLFATGLLHKLGKSILLHRASEMIKYGHLSVESKKGGFVVRRTEEAACQFLDNLEFYHLDRMQIALNGTDKTFWKGWELFDIRTDLEVVAGKLGCFLGRSVKKPMAEYRAKNIDELMLPLIFPWNSGHGVMTGYGALPEVDDHFFAEAVEIALKWRSEAGLHPRTRLGNICGADITLIVIVLAALHMKHIRFAMLAPKKFPQISVPQSLTIWGPLEEIENSIVSYSNVDRSLVRSGLDAVTFRPEETFHLDRITTPFVPLLISLGNGLVLRPVSSIMENPFSSILALDKWRNPKAWGEAYRYREEWMRSEIYGLFQGTRYRTVDGNIKIREGNTIVTDIDAAVLDTLTGELAIFQIKWQDYYTNDVRELRSKAANLTKELDEWAERVQSWLERHGKDALTRALRLRLNHGTSISGVYLFGISRSFARMRGFGFTTRHERLAVANWPLFLQIRYKIGPASRVLNELFDALRMKMDQTVVSQPLPFTITVEKESILFEDLWNIFDAGEEESL